MFWMFTNFFSKLHSKKIQKEKNTWSVRQIRMFWKIKLDVVNDFLIKNKHNKAESKYVNNIINDNIFWNDWQGNLLIFVAWRYSSFSRFVERRCSRCNCRRTRRVTEIKRTVVEVVYWLTYCWRSWCDWINRIPKIIWEKIEVWWSWTILLHQIIC